MKFKFTVEFQFDLLKYTVIDKNGYKAIELYDDSYFSLTEHSVIAYTIKSYYKKRKVIPCKTVLIEELYKTFEHRDFINNLTEDDRKEILSISNSLFKGIVQDGDEILASTEKFAQYVDLKHEVENVDLLDYDQYDIFSRKIQKAISPRLKVIEERGAFLVKDARYRQVKRKEKGSIVPMPWRQLDRLTNAGGYARNSIMVVLDKAKKFKTGALVNVAKRYMQYYKKNVLVIDLDGGQDEFLLRTEQSIAGVTKSELLDEHGVADETIRDKIRRSRRQGGEIIAKRMPALITTAADIGNYIDFLYREYGIQIEILIIDYIAKMGAISGKDSLHERISDAYIDISNLALAKNIDLVWTAQHVTREAAKAREKDTYESTDIAGAIDVSRHVQAIFGLNRNTLEETKGFQRFEIVDQRDGPSHGHVVFKIDYERQRLTPLGVEALQDYYKNCRPKKDPEDSSYEGSRKKNRKGDLDAK
jgi:hypothetical protein